jgi:glycosyltransferase involved in cell wall biosynthesis
MKIDLHLVSWNRPKMTELTIKTIHRNTKPENFRLVVLDNGSEGETPEHLQELADNGLIDEYLPIKTNLGLEYARNLLLNNCTQSDYFICVDNDCLPPPIKDGLDWTERLYELMQKYEDYAAISARTDPMIGTGNIFEEADKNGEDIVDFPHPGGSLRIMNTKLVYQVRGWTREDGFVGNRGAEERLICGKLRDFGYKTAFATDIRTLHLYGPAEKTDRWGYPKEWKPEDTGHSDIWHPKFGQGDDPAEIEKYAGEELTEWYL